jgi:hypothetical protein
MSKAKYRDISPDRTDRNKTPEVTGKVSEIVEPDDVPSHADLPRMLREAYRTEEYDDLVVVLRPQAVPFSHRVWSRLTRGPPSYLEFVMLPRDERPSTGEYVAVEAGRVRMQVPQTWRYDE